MATVTPEAPQTSEPQPSQKSKSRTVAYREYVDSQLRRTRSQVKWVEIAGALAMLFVAVLGTVLLVALFDHWIFPLGTFLRWAVLIGLLAGTGAYLALKVVPLFVRRINTVYAAHTIEEHSPSLKNSLVNLLMLRGSRDGVSRSVLKAVESQAATGLSHVPVEAAVDRSRIIKLGYVLLALFMFLAAYTLFSPKSTIATVKRIAAPWANIDAPTRVIIAEVTPGDTSVFGGEFVEVEALIDGIDEDEPVTLYYSTSDRRAVDRPVEMQLLDGSLRHQAALPQGTEGLQEGIEYTYYVAAGDARSQTYTVTVNAPPRIAVTEIKYDYPAYTRRAAIQQTEHAGITALEGTQVTITAEANQEIDTADVDFNCDGRPDVHMKVSDKNIATATFLLPYLKEDGRAVPPPYRSYQITFKNKNGDRNARPVRNNVDIIPDLAPEVSITAPRENVIQVPVNGTARIDVSAIDQDYALTNVVVQAERDDAAGVVVFQEQLLSREHQNEFEQTFVFSPQKYGLQPGDVIRYWALARDNRHEYGQLQPNVSRSAVDNAAPRRIEIVEADNNQNQQNDQQNQGQQDNQQQDNDQNATGQNNQAQNDQNDGQQDRQNQGQQDGGQDNQDANNSDGNNSDNSQNQQGSGDQGNQGNDGGEQSLNQQTGQGGQANEQQNQDGNNGQQGQQQGGQSQLDQLTDKAQQLNDQNQNSQGQQDSGSEQNQQQNDQNQPGNQNGGQQDANQDSAQQQNSDSQGNQDTQGQGAQDQGAQDQGTQDNAQQQDAGNQDQTGNQGGGQKQNDQAQDTGGDNSDSAQQQNAGNQNNQSSGAQQQNNTSANQDNAGNNQDNANQQGNQSADQRNDAGAGSQNQQDANQDNQQAQNNSGAGSPKDNAAGGQQGQGGSDQQNSSSPGDPENRQKDSTGQTSDEEKQNSNNADEEAGAANNLQEDRSGAGTGSKEGGKHTDADKPKGQDDASQAGGNEDKRGGAGAGENNNDAGKGSPKQYEEQGVKPEKNQQNEGNEKPLEKNEAPAGSTSKKESDSKGDSDGDRSGGGGTGGGQQANNEGTGGAGSNTDSEEGANASQTQGTGETGDKAGDDVKSEDKTGQSGDEKGAGSGTRDGDEQRGDGTRQDGPQQGDQNSQENNAQPKDSNERNSEGQAGEQNNQQSPQQGGQESQGNGRPQGGGNVGADHGPREGELDPGGEDANLTDAEKAADMVLNNKDALLENYDSDPDLQKLFPDKNALRDYLDNLQQLRQQAQQEGEAGEIARNALRNLKSRQIQGQSESDDLGGVIQSANSKPPAEYAESYRAFNRARRRGGK